MNYWMAHLAGCSNLCYCDRCCQNIVVPGEIMMVSMDFVVKPHELINLFCFDFVVTMVFYSVDEKSGSFYYVFLVL